MLTSGCLVAYMTLPSGLMSTASSNWVGTGLARRVISGMGAIVTVSWLGVVGLGEGEGVVVWTGVAATSGMRGVISRAGFEVLRMASIEGATLVVSSSWTSSIWMISSVFPPSCSADGAVMSSAAAENWGTSSSWMMRAWGVVDPPISAWLSS